MQATQRQILQLIFAAEQGISDQQLLEKIGKDIQEVRFHLDELSRGGFIELITSTTFNGDGDGDGDGKSYLATSVTPRGCMVLQGQISLEDRVDSKFDSQTFNITNNSTIGSQQFGNKNTATVTQKIGLNKTEVFQIIESLKQAVDTLPLNSQDVAAESLTIIEEEINTLKTPKNPSRIKTALFALWSVAKDMATFSNAVTALAERFNIHLPR
jgi:hypothetical protein